MKKGEGFNENGVPVTIFECDYCGEEFTVCPAVPDDNLHNWNGCLSTECESYNPNRDVDALMFFGVIDGIVRDDEL